MIKFLVTICITVVFIAGCTIMIDSTSQKVRNVIVDIDKTKE